MPAITTRQSAAAVSLASVATVMAHASTRLPLILCKNSVNEPASLARNAPALVTLMHGISIKPQMRSSGCSILTEEDKTMQVKYIHGKKGAYSSNIIWSPAVPMRGGKFPSSHPASPGSEFGTGAGDGQLGTSDKMTTFRERGYWASCFPEGDGITLDTQKDQPPEKVAQDIADVFGWAVRVQSS